MRLRRRRDPAARRRRLPLALTGVIVLVMILGGLYLATQRHAISADLASGRVVHARFDRQDLILPDRTPVKIAGVPVGVVMGLSKTGSGMDVAMKMFGHNADVLGTSPSAAVRINTLLGGITYIQLTPGGEPGSFRGTIPQSRTTTPVYIDSILAAVPPPAQQGAKQFVNQMSGTLTNGGEQAASKLLADAPAALAPTTPVLQGLQGEQPEDLSYLVDNLSRMASTLTAKPGQIESVVSALGSFSSTLGSQADALASTVAGLPAQLQQARAGLGALSGTLDELDATASSVRPEVQALGRVVTDAQPTLVAAAPVLSELQPLLVDLDPVLGQLVPTSTLTTGIIHDVQGPVINRILNPILPDLKAVNYVEDQTPSTLYQEIAYAAAQLDGALSYTDGTAHFVPVVLGFNAASNVPSQVAVPHDGCAGSPCPAGVQPPGVRP